MIALHVERPCFRTGNWVKTVTCMEVTDRHLKDYMWEHFTAWLSELKEDDSHVNSERSDVLIRFNWDFGGGGGGGRGPWTLLD